MLSINVRVKDGQRGFYGVPTETGATETGVAPSSEVIRNPGEVFAMSVGGMKRAGAPGTADSETVTVGKETYALPSWVESIAASETPITAADKVAKGHKTVHRDESTSVI